MPSSYCIVPGLLDSRGSVSARFSKQFWGLNVARNLFHVLQRLDLHSVGRRSEVMEFSRSHEDSALNVACYFVECIHACVEASAKSRKVPTHVRKAFIEFLTQLTNCQRVLSELLLLPAVRDGT